MIIGYMEDWIKDGNGRMRRVHKRYVDVVAHMRDDGFLEPLSIAWRDGRTFRVTQVIEVGEFRPGFEGFFTGKIPRKHCKPKNELVPRAAPKPTRNRHATNRPMVGS